MNWKVVFLALLILSAVAVTIGIATLQIDVPKILYAGARKVVAPTQMPLEIIDDECGGG